MWDHKYKAPLSVGLFLFLYPMPTIKEICTSLLEDRSNGNVSRWLAIVAHEPLDVPAFVGFVEAEQSSMRWHLTWFLSNYAQQHPTRLTPHVPIIWKLLTAETPMGMQRDIWRALAFTDVQSNEGAIYDTALEVITSENLAIAVRANAMTCAFNVCIKYPDLKRELQVVLEGLHNHPSKGIHARSKNLLIALHKV